MSSFVSLEKNQGSERLSPTCAQTTALLNQPPDQLTDDRRIDMHDRSAKPPNDPRKVFLSKQSSKALAFFEKEVYLWDS